MPETSTKQLVEDVDSAIRDAYHTLRTALHKVEDLKMQLMRQPESNPFGPEHDEMYRMYLSLSERFQATREGIRDRSHGVTESGPSQTPESPVVQTPVQPRSSTLEPALSVEEPPVSVTPSPLKRNKGRPYVLVPVGSVTALPFGVWN